MTKIALRVVFFTVYAERSNMEALCMSLCCIATRAAECILDGTDQFPIRVAELVYPLLTSCSKKVAFNQGYPCRYVNFIMLLFVVIILKLSVSVGQILILRHYYIQHVKM